MTQQKTYIVGTHQDDSFAYPQHGVWGTYKDWGCDILLLFRAQQILVWDDTAG